MELFAALENASAFYLICPGVLFETPRHFYEMTGRLDVKVGGDENS